MQYNIFFYFYPSFRTFFHGSVSGFFRMGSGFLADWIRTQKKSDPDPGTKPDPKHCIAGYLYRLSLHRKRSSQKEQILNLTEVPVMIVSTFKRKNSKTRSPHRYLLQHSRKIVKVTAKNVSEFFWSWKSMNFVSVAWGDHSATGIYCSYHSAVLWVGWWWTINGPDSGICQKYEETPTPTERTPVRALDGKIHPA